jgi:hypothetical protein
MRGSFTITTIGRSIGMFDRELLAREAPQTHPGFKELVEVKGEVLLGVMGRMARFDRRA